ncbi:MAG: hypothetical protein HC767_06350, partial [Akkermansiaceae bacterium]|nr:hypothetical protein [Akkermansiaceae bacterium]
MPAKLQAMRDLPKVAEMIERAAATTPEEIMELHGTMKPSDEQAGHPVPVAIEMVAREVEDPIGSEFGHALDEMNYGQDRSTALRGIADRYTSPEFLFLVSSIEMQKETGGNLAEILSNLSKVIRERAMMRKKS